MWVFSHETCGCLCCLCHGHVFFSIFSGTLSTRMFFGMPERSANKHSSLGHFRPTQCHTTRQRNGLRPLCCRLQPEPGAIDVHLQRRSYLQHPVLAADLERRWRLRAEHFDLLLNSQLLLHWTTIPSRILRCKYMKSVPFSSCFHGPLTEPTALLL